MFAYSRPSSQSGANETDPILPIPHGGNKYGSLRHSTGGGHLSTSSFKLLEEEINRQKRQRPLTVSGAEADVELADKPNYGRRTLYGSLPFVAAFGMSRREEAIRKVLSTVSISQIENEETISNASDQDVDIDKIILTFPLLMATLVAIVSQFLLGYNTSVMNAPAAVVFPDHTTAQWSLAVSTFAIGGPIGALLGGSMANTYGRRGAMMINNIFFLIGGLIMTAAPTIYWLIPGRLLIGCASGISTVVVPIYLGEIAPPTLRGTLGTCTQFAMTMGILVSGLVAFPLATPTRWRYIFAITPFLCIVQMLASSFLLESPRWLLGKDEKSMMARMVIRKLRGYRTKKEIEDEVQNFLFASKAQDDDEDDDGVSGALDEAARARKRANKPSALWSLLTAADMRPLLISAVVLQLGQQLSGINAVFYYSTMFFDGIISNPLLGTVMVGILNVLATYAALLLMDNTGRRTLILISSGGMIVCTVLIMTALLGYTYKIVAAMAVMGFVSFFEIGLGPIPWLIVAEMFDTKYVATAMSMSCVVNWICNFLVGFFFPFMQDSLGSWSFGPFFLVLVAVFLYSTFFLVETQGRSVEEVQRLTQSSFAGGDYEGDLHRIPSKNEITFRPGEAYSGDGALPQTHQGGDAEGVDKLTPIIHGVEMDMMNRDRRASSSAQQPPTI